jgi:protein-tyrosine-phosphatase
VTDYAQWAVKELYGKDLLASHRSQGLTPELIEKADLILVMTNAMKHRLPPEKTWTIKEYAGEKGDVADPIGKDEEVYLACAKTLTRLIEAILPKL